MGLFKALLIAIISVILSNIIIKNIDRLKIIPYYSLVEPYIKDKGYTIALSMFILMVLF